MLPSDDTCGCILGTSPCSPDSTRGVLTTSFAVCLSVLTHSLAVALLALTPQSVAVPVIATEFSDRQGLRSHFVQFLRVCVMVHHHPVERFTFPQGDLRDPLPAGTGGYSDLTLQALHALGFFPQDFRTLKGQAALVRKKANNRQ